MSLGTSPYKSFDAKANETSDERLYKDGGTVPVRLFIDSCSCCNVFRWPNSRGIGPLRVLVPRFSVLRDDKFPMDVGIGPVSWF